MKIDFNNFVIKKCSQSDFNDILQIQDDVFKELTCAEILRKNSPEMLLECLNPPHITIGAFYKDTLAAFSVLYFPYNSEEDLSIHLDNVETSGLKSVNYKLCIVKKEFRGNSLQYELGMRLNSYALEAGADIICVTASPHNAHSIKNIEKMGFIYNKTLNKYGFERNLYYKFI